MSPLAFHLRVLLPLILEILHPIAPPRRERLLLPATNTCDLSLLRSFEDLHPAIAPVAGLGTMLDRTLRILLQWLLPSGPALTAYRLGLGRPRDRLSLCARRNLSISLGLLGVPLLHPVNHQRERPPETWLLRALILLAPRDVMMPLRPAVRLPFGTSQAIFPCRISMVLWRTSP